MSHPTSVIHPATPIGQPIVVNQAAAEQFGFHERKLPPGSFASPVKIGNLNFAEKGLKELEKPVFISKNQNNLEAAPMVGNSQKISNVVVNAAKLDAATIKRNLKQLKANDKLKRLNACIIIFYYL